MCVARVALEAVGQVVLGALLTHSGWVEPHLAGAVFVYALVPTVASRVRRAGDDVAARTAVLLLSLLGAQLALGVGALVARLAPGGLPAPAVLALALPAAHRLMGSAILGAVAVLALRCATAGTPRQHAPAFRGAEGLRRRSLSAARAGRPEGERAYPSAHLDAAAQRETTEQRLGR